MLFKRITGHAILALLLASVPLFAQPGSVVLPSKDYRKLLEDLETAKKAMPEAKPAPPSTCKIHCELKRTKNRPLAVLTVIYEFRTMQPRSSVLLGGQKAFAVKASLDGGNPPALESTPDGLVAVLENSGEHSLAITYEKAISTRNAKGDLGFEIGLPRAAITTVTLAPPGGDLKSVTLFTRWPDAANKPGELKTIALDPGQLTKSHPLGPTDVLEMTWDAPRTVIVPSEPTLETEISVRVEESRVETIATLKLRGPMKDWTLTLPAGAVLTGDAKITRPDGEKNDWKVSFSGTEVTLTSILRTSREQKESRRFSVGPYFASGAVRQTGLVKFFAPVTLRFNYRPATDVRRIEQPNVFNDDSPIASFRYQFLPATERKPVALIDFDIRQASGFVAIQPNCKLTLTPLGWKLRCEYRVAPVRTAIEQVAIELPAGWLSPTLAPLDLVEEVSGDGDANQIRTLAVRLVAPQREPFELVLETRWPLNGEIREASLLMPRVLQARERDALVSASVPETLELSGSVREWDTGKVAAVTSEFPRSKSSQLGSTFDNGVARVDLAWRPDQPRINANCLAEITLGERQFTVSETIKLTFPDGAKSVKLAGPAASGFRASPPLEPLGPGEWTFVPPAGSKEAAVTLSYSLPLKGESKLTAPLVWPEASALTATVRIWNANPLRRVADFKGPWRELAPEPNPERDMLPALTLAANGHVPLTLGLEDADPIGSVIVDRAVYQWWIGEAGVVQGRCRYLLKRWPVNLDIDPAGATGFTAHLDNARVETVPRAGMLRLTLPEARPNRPTMLELRFSGPTGRVWAPVSFDPPRLRGAVLCQPAWCQIVPPADSLPFIISGQLTPELGWHWNRYGVAPGAAMNNSDLDRWLNDGVDSDHRLTGDAAVTARQPAPVAIRIVLIPRLIALLITAGIVVVSGLLLAVTPRRQRAIILGTFALLAAVLAVILPQPASQVTFLAQPALALLALVLGGQWLLRYWANQRDRSEATFIRAAPSGMTDRSSHRSSSKALPVTE